MSINFYDPAERYRRRSMQRLVAFIVFIICISVILGIGVWFGNISSKQNRYFLEEKSKKLQDDQQDLQDEITRLRAEVQTSNVRLEQLRTSYNELLSDSVMRKLVTLLQTQVQKGVDPKRLESVILSARPPQNCSDPESKRFVIITPVYNGPQSYASIARGAVVISGTGMSAQNSQGQKEAWFDPSQPVEILFKDSNGEVATKKGTLPIYHSMVIGGDKEYRFTLSASSKSFVKITYDHCDYP